MNKIIKSINTVCCIGAGYVGGPTMAVIAKHCKNIKVTVLDINQDKINAWNSENLDDLPVYEPGLKEIVRETRGKNLFFSTDIAGSLEKADMVFISVNTPTKSKGLGAGYASDLKWVEASARTVSEFAKGHTIVVEKSTVPVRTAELIKEILILSCDKKDDKKTFSVLSSPEFLAEGSAIKDLESPDRVLIGGDNQKAIHKLSEIYQKWIPKNKILHTNLWSSELSKLTANAFLAQRVTSINAIAALCEPTGAKIKEVSNAIGYDSRIGEKFLEASPGFGGSCFKKDILNLVYLCRYYGLEEIAKYWEQVSIVNEWQKLRIASLIVDKLYGTVSLKNILILGFSFKANTNDTRESASISISRYLIDNGAKLLIHDPQVNEKQIANDLKENSSKIDCSSEGGWSYINNIYKSAKGVDAIVVLTEWDLYKTLEWEKLFELMRKPAWVFDTRSVVNSENLEKIGFRVWKLGQ